MSRKNKKILVTGGSGYIGSHMAYMLLDDGWDVTVIDNLSTGLRSMVPAAARFIKGDLRRKRDVFALFDKNRFFAIIHFAALSQVEESMVKPQLYYENNVEAFANLLAASAEHGVDKIVFSSSASVYRGNNPRPLKESSPLGPVNVYGKTKLAGEGILTDFARKYSFSAVTLRYFNVAGAHDSGLTGEAHKHETHLVPCLLRVLKKRKKPVNLFGDDYPTFDGSCVRDYIHVTDICRAHLLALETALPQGENEIFNLGSGKGYSVKEVIAAAEKVTGIKANIKIMPRRNGDIAQLIACSDKARTILSWSAKAGLDDIIASAWKWEAILDHTGRTR